MLEIAPQLKTTDRLATHAAIKGSQRTARIPAHPKGGYFVREMQGKVAIHGLVHAVHTAFAGHLDLELRPDALWFTILQGLAAHVKKGRNRPISNPPTALGPSHTLEGNTVVRGCRVRVRFGSAERRQRSIQQLNWCCEVLEGDWSERARVEDELRSGGPEQHGAGRSQLLPPCQRSASMQQAEWRVQTHVTAFK